MDGDLRITRTPDHQLRVSYNVISSGQGRGGIPAASSSGALDRLPQPLHSELDIRRLQIAPAFELGLISVFWEAAEILCGQLPGARVLPGELLANEGISGHALLKRGRTARAAGERLPYDFPYWAR